MQYWIISPERFTPTIIFTSPNSGNWQRVSNRYLNAFWLATPFLGVFGLPTTLAFLRIVSNWRMAIVDWYVFAAWRTVSVIERNRTLISDFNDGLYTFLSGLLSVHCRYTREMISLRWSSSSLLLPFGTIRIKKWVLSVSLSLPRFVHPLFRLVRLFVWFSGGKVRKFRWIIEGKEIFSTKRFRIWKKFVSLQCQKWLIRYFPRGVSLHRHCPK